MVNYVVVDDNTNHRKKICDIIMSNMMSNQINFKINEFCDYSQSLLNHIENKNNLNIYVLDLELPSGDGIDVARTIRNKEGNRPLLLTIDDDETNINSVAYVDPEKREKKRRKKRSKKKDLTGKEDIK